MFYQKIRKQFGYQVLVLVFTQRKTTSQNICLISSSQHKYANIPGGGVKQTFHQFVEQIGPNWEFRRATHSFYNLLGCIAFCKMWWDMFQHILQLCLLGCIACCHPTTGCNKIILTCFNKTLKLLEMFSGRNQVCQV